jgi:MOSC domain-containing protein YiiM
MKIVSVNVGLPREVPWRGRTITTGIFKEPVEGSVTVRRLNLDGDRQADLSVHGGADKAVYAYPAEHYDYWQGELPDMELPWGMFGENLTTEGLLEDKVNIGDRFRIGSVALMATQPRMPCYKLGIKFGRNDIIKRFLWSGRSGFYFSVLEEGEVSAGDAIKLINRDSNNVTVADITSLYVRQKGNLDLLHRAVQVEALPEGWRGYFQHQIEELG